MQFINYFHCSWNRQNIFTKQALHSVSQISKEGIQISGGLFISPETLKATELLPDNLPKAFAHEVSEQVNDIDQKVKEIVEIKGFNNFYSLLLHSERVGGAKTFDTRCHPSACWYCKDLCVFCMEPCSVGCEAINENDNFVFRFCSNCWKVFGKTASHSELCFLHYEKLTEEGEIYTNHETLLSLKWSHNGVKQSKITICVGTGSGFYKNPYVLIQTRTLHNQVCTEWFISKDLTPVQLVILEKQSLLQLQPYLKDDDAVQSISSTLFSTHSGREALTMLNSFFTH